MDINDKDSNLNKNLFGIMYRTEEGKGDEVNRSPPKNKAKKASINKNRQKGKPKEKNAVKGALKASFKDLHVHNFLRTLVEASIELKGESPMQEFVVALQELLQNGQMVDKSFTFCPVKEGSGAQNISVPSGIPTNMTLLSCHFKLSSSKGRNPFEKQKVFKNNKEVKGELLNPSIYFLMAIAMDEVPEDLIARIIHEWHSRGGLSLRVKELQSFKSETILCLFNVLTATNKKTILSELNQILAKAQEHAQEIDATEFF
jgi:hypothetical protein